MKHIVYLFMSVLFIAFTSCSKKEAYTINLKWNKAYPKDSFERSITGLKWALSYLGSTVANDSTILKFNAKDSIIIIDIKALGFSDEAESKLARLQYQFQQTESYKQNSSYDLGRYIAMTFGNPKHYYSITDVSKFYNYYNDNYKFSDTKGYVNNSSVSMVHRIILFSEKKVHKQAFVSIEIDSITRDTLEYETAEIMPNGLLKFGIYDTNGLLKDAASPKFTRAGTPAKCIWCHEVGIQPLFKPQQNYNGYLDYFKLDDTLTYFNQKVRKFQDSQWVDKTLTNKKLHTELELVYIAFMEPSARRISREWQMPIEEVKQKLAHLETHVHEEFPFLGKLYHRKDVDALSPLKVLGVVESIREPSNNVKSLID
ncbi:MAG: hypothetical protein HRU49_11790 [Winogradskyella sp.]|uniref:hypothetical protein n=1 Tax=Winogradskyella sp. TaxID=1883156 RepID=UPI0025E35A3C|nr:hypothetical protein [Winogradskyella sp.]NRB84439.1 hypothetical protein [Winogradskyella sp.]